MNIHVLYQGIPAKFIQGYLSWPTCVYVESSGVKILFDTGFVTQRHDLPEKLKNMAGVYPEDIDILVLSHLHYDHAYNFDLFSEARILAHTKEIEHAVTVTQKEFAYQRFLTDAIIATGRLTGVDEGYAVAPGVTTLFVPGHTPGCMALLLTHESRPATVLAGDAVKNIGELATGRMPMVTQPEEAAASIRKIRSCAQVVIPGHDRRLHVFPDRIEAVSASELTLKYAQNCVPSGHPKEIALGLPACSLLIEP